MNKSDSLPNRRKLKMSSLFGMACVIGWAVGLTDLGGDMFSGLCRAFGSVFFALGFISLVIEKAAETES